MIISLLKKHILNNISRMVRDVREVHDFMVLLMKRRYTGVKWTLEEISQLKSHMKQLAFCLTFIIIFVLPFGLLLLPLYTGLLDRREKK